MAVSESPLCEVECLFNGEFQTPSVLRSKSCTPSRVLSIDNYGEEEEEEGRDRVPEEIIINVNEEEESKEEDKEGGEDTS